MRKIAFNKTILLMVSFSFHILVLAMTPVKYATIAAQINFYADYVVQDFAYRDFAQYLKTDQIAAARWAELEQQAASGLDLEQVILIKRDLILAIKRDLYKLHCSFGSYATMVRDRINRYATDQDLQLALWQEKQDQQAQLRRWLGESQLVDEATLVGRKDWLSAVHIFASRDGLKTGL